MKLRPDRVLGTLLGMSIGDALGMPVEGWTREAVRERFGIIQTYHALTFEDGTELAAGEFTDESEGALCIVESYTANSGELDPENIRARLEILSRGESRRWMNPATLALLESEDVNNADTAPVMGDVAARGIPLGLIAAGAAAHNPAGLKRQAALLSGVTHASKAATETIEMVAAAVRATALQEVALSELSHFVATSFPNTDVAAKLGAAEQSSANGMTLDTQIADIGLGNPAEQVVAGAILAASHAGRFEDAVFVAASQGGAADARGAIAGALAGAAFGTAGIPQSLIDGLESRVYVMLAAPWFYQTIQLRNAFGQQIRMD